MKKLWLCLGLIATMLLITACSSDEDAHKDDKQSANGKIKIIEYGDFKCSYCKKVESNIMPKLKKDYIDKDKVDYQFVNMAFLGDDSIIGSRAGHAVQQIAPKQYLEFQKLMFEQQGDAEKEWITESLVDKQIDKLSTDNNQKEKIKKDYIDKDKVDYQFVNMAFLGDDSIIGSRAGHAVQQIAPKQYLEFQKLMFEQQGDAEKEWITESLVDKQIDKLSTDNNQKEKIKKDYKTEDSKSWKAAKKDQKQAEDKNIDTAPTVYIGGEKVEEPYDYDNYKKLIEKNK